MILVLSLHYTRVSDVVRPDHLLTSPSIPVRAYRDSFGNWCTRIVAPAGELTLSADGVVNDSGVADLVVSNAQQTPVECLPEEAIGFLLGSRYCETDRMTSIAWELFGKSPPGWGRVQAVCDFVHSHVHFDYAHARPTRSAWETFQERQGVCRDFAHLAITLCRCLNIPSRYCTGYLGDIRVPPVDAPMDFSGWFEAFLDGQWYTFDARFNTPRVGRILIGRGRDASDVAISTSFGPNTLSSFKVWADEVIAAPPSS
jgi:transglutaminase-like putative cysteine protease